jgi:hypothetical protein
MAHDADANRAAKRWLWLLVLPLIAMVWRRQQDRTAMVRVSVLLLVPPVVGVH